MMEQIIVPMVIIGGLGLILGGLLGVANRYLKVETDPRIEELTQMLPGYNCGSCGFAGCKGLAEDMIQNGTSISSCKPCSKEKQVKIMKYLEEVRN